MTKIDRVVRIVIEVYSKQSGLIEESIPIQVNSIKKICKANGNEKRLQWILTAWIDLCKE